MASGNATVKAVLSADTLVLVGKSVNGSPPEITITLSNIQTPKIARGPQQTDEPFSWEAREFLRRFCIGKQVTFKVVSTVPSINRSFGDVFLNGENLNKAIIAAGWGTVKDQRDNSEGNDYEILIGLANAAKASKLGIHTDDALKKRNAVRQINWALDAVAYATNLLGAKNAKVSSNSVRAVVEHVRDGASFRCYLPSASGYVSIALAGIVCPRVNSGNSKSDGEGPAAPEAFALQARHFSEMRLLNREVDIAVHGAAASAGKVASDGSLLVTIVHPKGNLTLELVKAGLGKVADWTLALLPRETVISLRAAEIEAKSNRRGVWYAYIPPVPSPECRAFEGRVIEVISGDTIIVAERNPEGGFTESRIAFASIRVPRLASGGPAGRTSVSEPFAAECKEFVRSRLIGRQVLVSVEYVREKRNYASVYYGKPTRQPGGLTRPGFLISEQLIAEGLAQTVKHRPDEPRAEAYDTMLVDEAEAQRKKKGIHSNPGAPAIESTARGVNDLTSDGKKAKAFFNLLQKDKSFRAMVDYVFTGSRFKLTIPSENATINFALAQVRCPNLSKAQPANATLEEGEVPPSEDPLNVWAETAKRFSRLNVLQRMVEIEFTDIDRNGVMLGRIFLVGEKSPTSRAMRGHSYAVDLVTEGLASVDKYAAHRGGPEVDTLLELQRKAQELRSGLWSVPAAHIQNEPEHAEEESDKQGSGETGVVRVRLTEIYTGSTFGVHINGPASAGGEFAGRGSDVLAEIEATMAASADALGSSSLAAAPRKGNLVACLHDDPTANEGSAWIRARVEEVIGSSVKVFFVDYGHRADVSVSTLRSLTEEMAAFTPQAIDCSLAFLRAPPLGSEFGVPAARALNALAWDKECMMKVLSSSDPSSTNSKPRSHKSSAPSSSSSALRYAVVLFALPSNGEELDIENALNVNEKLVRNGFVRISATASRRLRGGKRRGNYYETDHSTGSVAADALAVLEAAQAQAHAEHLRMWVYGHPGDSDDEMEEKRAAA